MRDLSGLQVVEAGMRSLKMVYKSSLAPREHIFKPAALSCLVARLREPQRLTAEVAACIIARCCQRPEHQEAVTAAHGLEAMLPLLATQRWSCREAALEALVAITRDNRATCGALLSCSPDIVATSLGEAAGLWTRAPDPGKSGRGRRAVGVEGPRDAPGGGFEAAKRNSKGPGVMCTMCCNFDHQKEVAENKTAAATDKQARGSKAARPTRKMGACAGGDVDAWQTKALGGKGSGR